MCCRDPTVVAYLSVNIHVTGWITDPVLTLMFKPPTTESKTLNAALLDPNGLIVTDTFIYNIPAGTSTISINLGDFINAQRTVRNLPVGQYFLLIKIVEDNAVFTQNIFLSSTATTIPSDPDNAYLGHIAVIDKVTGTLLKLPPTLNLVPTDDRYLVFLYYHKEGKGRLVKLLGPAVELDTGYHKFVKLKITLKFNTATNLLYYMYMRAWNIPRNVATALLDAIEAGEITEAVRLLKPLYAGLSYSLGRGYVEIDTASNEIREYVYVYLGQIDWAKVFGFGALGCGLAAAVAIAITIYTAGVGSVTLPLVLGACMAGAAAGVGVAVITSTTSLGTTQIREEARATGNKAKGELSEAHADAINLLNTWLAQGKITQEDFNKMKELLDRMKDVSFTAIDELVNDVEEAYREGYRKGVDESKHWIIASGIGGALLGLLIGRR